jgi:hypothetical protein
VTHISQIKKAFVALLYDFEFCAKHTKLETDFVHVVVEKIKTPILYENITP